MDRTSTYRNIDHVCKCNRRQHSVAQQTSTLHSIGHACVQRQQTSSLCIIDHLCKCNMRRWWRSVGHACGVKCQPTLNLCSLLIYTPLVRHRLRRNRCVFSCKMRLGFNFDCKFTCHSRQPRRNRCAFQSKMRLVFFTVIVN